MSSREGARTAHGYLQTARGMCTDEAPYTEIDAMIAKAVDRVKDIEAERDRYRTALEAIRAEFDPERFPSEWQDPVVQAVEEALNA